MVSIVAFAGSNRRESFNRKLVRSAVAGAEEAGASVTLVDLADYPMPLFDQDLEAEQGMPEPARAFKRLLIQHDGFLISSPEYNGLVSPLLKNALDWASRAEAENEPPYAAYKSKVAAVMAASPGALGGLRGLVHLRQLLANLQVTVLPGQQTLGQASRAFDEEGRLVDDRKRKAVHGLAAELVRVLARLKGEEHAV
jgi:NAD(P)H-dependent FMN reductase